MMVICKCCNQEMLDHENTITCSNNTKIKFPDGIELESKPHNLDIICHDCGISKGGKHHPGCDMERCPRCGGQLISCSCWDEIIEIKDSDIWVGLKPEEGDLTYGRDS